MEPDMTDMVVVITGANSGIGKMTAVGLARAGATVVMACRDLAKSRSAQADVRSLSAPSRVLMLAGSAQRFGKIHWDDLQREQKYSMMRAGGQSRVANLLFMRALAPRAKSQGVTVNAIDPGGTITGISRDLPAPVRLLTRPSQESR
jgi:NAD(P)-dependent dehydrogenase (short-subunit alcohol dehydrogenase family)